MFTDRPVDLDETCSGPRVHQFLDYLRDELIRGLFHNPHDRKGGGLQNDGSVLGGDRRRILMQGPGCLYLAAGNLRGARYSTNEKIVGPGRCDGKSPVRDPCFRSRATICTLVSDVDASRRLTPRRLETSELSVVLSPSSLHGGVKLIISSTEGILAKSFCGMPSSSKWVRDMVPP